MPDDDPMDVPEVHRRLGEALRLQYRSALLYATVAATVTGVEGLRVADLLSEYADLELADVRRLTEKLVALGGEPPADVPSLPLPAGDLRSAIDAVATAEEESLAALHAVIEPSGQQPESEALEHLMEHVITRKQAQVDRLRRALMH